MPSPVQREKEEQLENKLKILKKELVDKDKELQTIKVEKWDDHKLGRKLWETDRLVQAMYKADSIYEVALEHEGKFHTFNVTYETILDDFLILIKHQLGSEVTRLEFRDINIVQEKNSKLRDFGITQGS